MEHLTTFTWSHRIQSNWAVITHDSAVYWRSRKYRVRGTTYGMISHRQRPISLSYIIDRCSLGHAQNLVIVLMRHECLLLKRVRWFAFAKENDIDVRLTFFRFRKKGYSCSGFPLRTSSLPVSVVDMCCYLLDLTMGFHPRIDRTGSMALAALSLSSAMLLFDSLSATMSTNTSKDGGMKDRYYSVLLTA
jgi:hypothetical protein